MNKVAKSKVNSRATKGKNKMKKLSMSSKEAFKNLDSKNTG
jgi:hypothetical protein